MVRLAVPAAAVRVQRGRRRATGVVAINCRGGRGLGREQVLAGRFRRAGPCRCCAARRRRRSSSRLPLLRLPLLRLLPRDRGPVRRRKLQRRVRLARRGRCVPVCHGGEGQRLLGGEAERPRRQRAVAAGVAVASRLQRERRGQRPGVLVLLPGGAEERRVPGARDGEVEDLVQEPEAVPSLVARVEAAAVAERRDGAGAGAREAEDGVPPRDPALAVRGLPGFLSAVDGSGGNALRCPLRERGLEEGAPGREAGYVRAGGIVERLASVFGRGASSGGRRGLADEDASDGALEDGVSEGDAKGREEVVEGRDVGLFFLFLAAWKSRERERGARCAGEFPSRAPVEKGRKTANNTSPPPPPPRSSPPPSAASTSSWCCRRKTAATPCARR